MKVSVVEVYMVAHSRFHDVIVKEGEGGVTDLHFITREGTMGYNYIKGGRRQGQTFPSHIVERVDTLI